MIPLHIHSYYSFLQGTIPMDSLIEKAKEYALPAIALTDTNGMYGLVEFMKKAKEANIKPIPGAFIDDPSDKNINAVFLAMNRKGYSDLCRIITTRKLKEDFSLKNLLQDEFPDLVILIHSIELLKNIPRRKNIYAELISTGKERKNTRNLYEFAVAEGIKCVPTNPAYFLEREDFIIHRIVTAIKERGTFENLPDNELVDEEYYFRSPAELNRKWKTFPDMIFNTYNIAEMCNVDIGIGTFKYPVFSTRDNTDQFSFLWKLAFSGLEERYPELTKPVIKRLQHELDVINELSLSDYFLVVWDILREANSRRMVTIGRGSAANSLVCYCLGITQVDPVKYGFYFERFLNKGRSTPPDIDLDFSWKERDEIVKYVFEKYGYEHVAMISTHITFRARSAFRETAKVFGIPDSEISRYSKFIPYTDAGNIQNISSIYPEARSLKFDTEPWSTIAAIAPKLANFPRHLSIHPGGIVIVPEPITNYTALEYARNKGLGLIVTQPDMYGVEDIGLVKIDLLSQRSLGVLRDTLKQIENNNLYKERE
ncbi:MAG TPA: PHP domain-containing protein [Ignavibacteriaceae bacterium]|nr:PHP domain-containing protein [Ignavibacteriaceae bacterium]